MRTGTQRLLIISQFFLVFLMLSSVCGCHAESQVESYYNQAQSLYNLGKYPAALSSLDDALVIKPDDLRYRQLRLLILQKAGKVRDAEDEKNLIAELQKKEENKNTTIARSLQFNQYKQSGMSAMQNHQWVEAKDYFQKAYALDPFDPDVNSYLDYLNQMKYLSPENSRFQDPSGRFWNPNRPGAVLSKPSPIPGSVPSEVRLESPESLSRSPEGGALQMSSPYMKQPYPPLTPGMGPELPAPPVQKIALPGGKPPELPGDGVQVSNRDLSQDAGNVILGNLKKVQAGMEVEDTPEELGRLSENPEIQSVISPVMRNLPRILMVLILFSLLFCYVHFRKKVR